MQSHTFRTSAKHALRTVKLISIIVPFEKCHRDSSGLRTDTATILGPLANLCPSLTTLIISGDVGTPLLTAFGSACKKLTILDVTDVPLATCAKLSQLFPQVTSTRLSLLAPLGALEDQGENSNWVGFYRSMICSCSTLVSLDAGGNDLLQADWRALPGSLRKLTLRPPRCDAFQDDDTPNLPDPEPNLGPSAGVVLSNLRLVVISHPKETMHISLLARILHAAPHTQIMDLHNIYVPCREVLIPDLVFVHKALLEGGHVQESSVGA